MTDEKENNNSMGEQNTALNACCLSLLSCLGTHYEDTDGDEWVGPIRSTVVRLRDGCLGNFFDGKGLTEVTNLN